MFLTSYGVEALLCAIIGSPKMLQDKLLKQHVTRHACINLEDGGNSL